MLRTPTKGVGPSSSTSKYFFYPIYHTMVIMKTLVRHMISPYPVPCINHIITVAQITHTSMRDLKTQCSMQMPACLPLGVRLEVFYVLPQIYHAPTPRKISLTF